jgi:hypothetical protein
MAVTSTLAYNNTATITTVKSFTLQAPGVSIMKFLINVADSASE